MCDELCMIHYVLVGHTLGRTPFVSVNREVVRNVGIALGNAILTVTYYRT